MEEQHSSPAPQKQHGWTQRLIPNHFLPLCLPALTLPPLCFLLCLSLSLSDCAGAPHLTGPQWPWVINGLYGAGASFPSTFVCCSVSYTRNATGRSKTLMATAAGGVNLLLYSSCAESEPAVRMHQLINRLGVVYSQPVLGRTGWLLTHSVGGWATLHDVSLGGP